MENKLKYSVNIITDPEQSTEALNLRYRTYKRVYPKLLNPHNEPYESDSFDSRSIHLGLFCENGAEKKLAGYCRLITPPVFANKFSHLLLSEHPKYFKELHKETTDRIGLIERLPNPDFKLKIDSFCSNLESENIMYTETSRFIIDEDHRSISLSAFFVSSMIAVCNSLELRYNFFTCVNHHIAFYNRFGLTLFPGIEPFDNEVFGKQYVIFGSDLSLANSFQSTIRTLRLQLEEENQISFMRAA
ncbi:MAG: GNAT family N-acyltransferase [Bacteroidia bacterium]